MHPFASLVNYVRPEVPRVLINREAVGPFVRSSRDKRDSFWEGDADEGVRRLAEELGWTEEMEGMIDEGSEKLGKEWAAMAGGDDNSGEGREERRRMWRRGRWRSRRLLQGMGMKMGMEMGIEMGVEMGVEMGIATWMIWRRRSPNSSI